MARAEVRCDVVTLNKLLPYKSLVVTRLHERAAFTERVPDPEDGTVEQDPGQREPIAKQIERLARLLPYNLNSTDLREDLRIKAAELAAS